MRLGPGKYIRDEASRKATGDNKRKPLPHDEIIQRYQAGESLKVIARDYNVTSTTVSSRLKSLGVARRKCGTVGHAIGEEAHKWKGQSASYIALHMRVYKLKGQPTYCEICERNQPNGTKRTFEWANLTGRYDDVEDYARMCISCHRTFDANNRKAAKQK